MIQDAKYFNNISKKNEDKNKKYNVCKSRKLIMKQIKRLSKLGKTSMNIYDDFFEDLLFYNKEYRRKELFIILINDLDYYKSLGFYVDKYTYRDIPITKIHINWKDV